jgi:hypothetical protein
MYGSVGGLAAADMCGGLGLPAVPRAAVRDLACQKLAAAAAGARDRAESNAFGSTGGFYFGWVDDHGGSAAIGAAAERAGVATGGMAQAFGAADYLFGRNPWGASFVVGTAPNEVHHPHHPVEIEPNPDEAGDGLVVGGLAQRSQFSDFGLTPDPNSPYAQFDPRYGGAKIIYEDRKTDFITGECGLAYSAASLLMLAEIGGS